MDIWGLAEIEDGITYLAEVGPLSSYLRRLSDELLIAFERGNEYQTGDHVRPISPTDSRGKNLEWGRWIVGDGFKSVQLRPAMPDRPVVVRTEMPLKLPIGQKALFFVSIPIWVRVGAGESGQIRLCEEPTVVRSNIWFGDTMSGELCYSLLSRARRRVEEFDIRPHRVICPVAISNNATTMLELERFCVHVQHLTIYQGTEQLWTNEVHITFRGESAYSKVDYSQQKPQFEEVRSVLSEARVPFKKTLLKKSLSGFKMLSGFRYD